MRKYFRKNIPCFLNLTTITSSNNPTLWPPFHILSANFVQKRFDNKITYIKLAWKNPQPSVDLSSELRSTREKNG
ncbi:hypothetical protein EUGRSUZ_G02014 [Eucalyptus grandis]|uniref:Uncharacterized protein n=2 Tax=Eucalyptus grandis TaxID=71139 RepID=A0ACC3K551_EUCGR|nr:hypothetical protein EUGRSUZ_G02014 [Eucalyptus grandis]